MSESRRVAFVSDGLEMEGELVSGGPESKALVVACHGIPGSRSRDDAGYGGLAREIAAEGFDAFWFDFRGSRSAPGDLSIRGWARDLAAALDALARRPSVRPVVIAGSSAGGAVAIAVAAEREDVAAVATLAAPASFRFAGDDPARLVARLRNEGLIRDPAFPRDLDAWMQELEDFAAERHVASLSPKPLLVIHGDADEVVPYEEAERLFASAAAPKELARIPDGAHQLRRDGRAVACLLDWLNRLL